MVIELELEEQAKLSELAAANQLSEAAFLHEDVHWFLSSQGNDYTAAIREGDEDFGNGNVMGHDDVVASFSDVLKHL